MTTSTSTSTATGTATATGTERARRYRAYLTAEVDGASLAVFRAGFGALIFWEVVRYAVHGRIYRFYIEPRFFFSFLPFIKPWRGDGMYWHFAATGALALLSAAGLFYRVSSALLCAALTYVFLLDKTVYLNHLYLVCLVSLLLAVCPAERALSLDRVRAQARFARWCPAWGAPLRGSRSGEPPETVPRWALLVLRAQFALVYFYGGVAKLNRDWLRGEPLGSWLAEQADVPLVGAWLARPAAALVLCYAGLLIDLSAGFLLLSRRTFPFGAAVCVLFDLTNAFLFKIGIFPYLMILSLALFADPSWPRRLRGQDGAASALPARGAPSRSGAAAFVLAHLYLLVQLTLPLRHWLYPGDVSWTEAGHRFSWRMKLRDKEVGEVSFYLTDPRTGARQDVALEAWLTPRQIGEMSIHPDMIVDFAHHLADTWQQASGVRPVVTAKVSVSLNGGPYRDLVDPTLDLATQPTGPLHPPW